MIQTRQELDSFITSLDTGEVLCAIDTEADSLHRYEESLCLIQFSDSRQHVLIDSLAIEDLSPLGDYLNKAQVWMHGADYDMTMLKRQFGFIPPVVYDTQIAARLLGVERFGLANLVDQFIGVTLSKGSQKADWGQRPLSEEMKEYALNDVRYLFPLAKILVQQLKEKGRYSWFLQSCEASREKVLNREADVLDPWRIQGGGRLKRKGLAYLKAIWEWREEEAKAWDKPTFMVLSNKVMIEWCLGFEHGKFPRLPKQFRNGRRQRFQDVVDRIQDMPPGEYPKRQRTRRVVYEDGFEDQVKERLKQRNAIAAELEIDPSVIAPRAIMEKLVLDEAEGKKELLPWQKDVLGIS